MSDDPIVIVGGGLAGLACARVLQRAGVPWNLLERSDRFGGRVGGASVDGFTIDRGFQVLLDSYDEARRILDLDALELRPFEPGAIVRRRGRFVTIADPLRRPGTIPATLFSGIFGPRDAVAMMRLRYGGPAAPGTSTRARLRDAGVGDRALEGFFAPFLGGVFLERELRTPAVMFDFVFGHFARGSATLPRRGMQAIPDQLAGTVPASRLHRRAPVGRVESNRVVLDDGSVRPASAVVLALDDAAAARLVGRSPPDTPWHGTVQLSFAADRSPVAGAWLVLCGEPGGLVNHLCVPSQVAPDYAPRGESLVSVNLLGTVDEDDARLEARVREELRDWYGAGVDGWRLLDVARVHRALPQRFERASGGPGSPRISASIYRCGDQLEEPSIDGALRSGRAAAEAVLADRAAAGR